MPPQPLTASKYSPLWQDDEDRQVAHVPLLVSEKSFVYCALLQASRELHRYPLFVPVQLPDRYLVCGHVRSEQTLHVNPLVLPPHEPSLFQQGERGRNGQLAFVRFHPTVMSEGVCVHTENPTTAKRYTIGVVVMIKIQVNFIQHMGVGTTTFKKDVLAARYLLLPLGNKAHSFTCTGLRGSWCSSTPCRPLAWLATTHSGIGS